MSGIITRPVFWVIMIAMWSLVFHLIVGAYNGIYLNTVEAGATTSERFDRVIPKDNRTSEEAWQERTATVDTTDLANASGTSTFAGTTAYKLSEGTSGACKIGVLKLEATNTSGIDATEFYTPSGNVVQIAALARGIADKNIEISGCEWLPRSPIFGVFNGFIRVLLQVIALGGPLGFMLALAYFGSMLIGMATGHPVLRVVMVVIVVLVGAILVNIVLPYIGNVFHAIDGQRFIVFDQELGLIAVLLKNFFGVLFVSGLIGSAWSIIGQIRGSGTSSGSFQGSGM